MSDGADSVPQDWSREPDVTSTMTRPRRERLDERPDPCSRVQEFVTALHTGETASNN